MDYKQKYIKYKQKYLRLKGGAGTMYLPCEITTFTKEIYVSSALFHYIHVDTFKDINIPINRDTSPNNELFKQDAYILLKITDIENKLIKKEGEQDKGGNFISSPTFKISDSEIKDSKIFCFDGMSRELEIELNTDISQQIVKLKCSFTLNEYDQPIKNSRHIDECMCFMPYGLNKFKVWFYYIRNVTMNDSDYRVISSKQKYSKSGIDQEQQKYCEKYDLLLNCIPEIRQNLIKEQIDNLNLISNALFNKDYEIDDKNFVLFPIDINIELLRDRNLTISYKLKKVPIFNRLFIETPEKCNIFFSIDDEIDIDIKKILDIELQYVKCFTNNLKPISYEYVKTKKFHIKGSRSDDENNNTGNAGGNLHCLVKNIY